MKILTLENTRQAYLDAKNVLDGITATKERIDRERKEYLAKAEADFNLQHEKELQAISDATSEFNKANTNYRQEVINRYKETGETKVDEFASIRLTTKLEYDAEQAMAWAMNHKLALALDKSAFESFAKKDKSGTFSFVSTTQNVSVVISLPKN